MKRLAISGALLLLCAALCGCVSFRIEGDYGWDGHLVPEVQRASGDSEGRDLTPDAEFTGIDVAVRGDVDVTLRLGEPSVMVEADSAYFDVLDIGVKGGVLNIRTTKLLQRNMEIEITLPSLDSISLSGAADCQGVDAFSGDRLAIRLSGSSEMELSAEYTSIEIALSGASEADLSGACDTFTAELTGASRVGALRLEAQEADLALSGASRAGITALGRLQVRASGASEVAYKGTSDVSTSLSGGSSVRKTD